MSQVVHEIAYTAVSAALQVNAARPRIAAPRSTESTTPVMPAAMAATLSTIVATGGRHANSAIDTVIEVVTIADSTPVVPSLVARTIESSNSATATNAISNPRVMDGSG